MGTYLSITFSQIPFQTVFHTVFTNPCWSIYLLMKPLWPTLSFLCKQVKGVSQHLHGKDLNNVKVALTFYRRVFRDLHCNCSCKKPAAQLQLCALGIFPLTVLFSDPFLNSKLRLIFLILKFLLLNFPSFHLSENTLTNKQYSSTAAEKKTSKQTNQPPNSPQNLIFFFPGTPFAWLHISLPTRWLICNGGDHRENSRCLHQLLFPSITFFKHVCALHDRSLILIPLLHNQLTWP